MTGKEQYYTPDVLARELIAELEEVIGSIRGRVVLEPAGGTGAFVRACLEAGAKKLISFDIEPLHPNVNQGDFLKQELNIQKALTISNPPFGRNNSLSIPFFNHAAKVSQAIGFIVPRSWRKWSVINRLDQRFELVHDRDLEIDYVNASGEPIAAKNRLATCFQIWKANENLRPRIRITDMGVVEKVKPEQADVALTIFGYGCGKLRTDFPKVKNTTQLYLKLNHPRALEALGSVDFSRFYKNTAYTEALSLQEINFLLNEYIFSDPMIESR